MLSCLLKLKLKENMVKKIYQLMSLNDLMVSAKARGLNNRDQEKTTKYHKVSQSKREKERLCEGIVRGVNPRLMFRPCIS
jgi:hypothetical protein